jgi:uncharacterized protein YutE (UPF0331/DUF86 family)
MSPGQIDAAVVRRHLLALDEALQNLARHKGRPVEALRDDSDERWAVERGLQICAQNVLDVATHLAAVSGRDAPDYASATDELGRIGILPTQFAARLRDVAGFRNILVHLYLDVDVTRMHTLLNSRPDDFREFARHVEVCLQREDG